MSTILEALEKARRERTEAQYRGHSILDVAPHVPATSRTRRNRLATIVILTAIASLCVILLTAGALLALYQRLGTLSHEINRKATPRQDSVMPTFVVGNGIVQRVPPAQTQSESLAGPSEAVDLPPPIPMHEIAGDTPPNTAADRFRAPSQAVQAVATLPLAPNPEDLTRDPKTQADGFTLGAILYDPKVPMAVVNGITVREGMVYDDFRVLKITPSAVTVQRAGAAPVTLRLQR